MSVERDCIVLDGDVTHSAQYKLPQKVHTHLECSSAKKRTSIAIATVLVVNNSIGTTV